MIVGMKDKIALEFKTDAYKGRKSYGSLFIYLNGKKYGDENQYYEHFHSIVNVLTYYKAPTKYFPTVFNCSGDVILDSMCKYIKYEHEMGNSIFQHIIQKDVPSFLEIADELDVCVFRYVPYAFDNCFIVIVPTSGAIKICIRDEENGNHSSALTTFNEFYELWSELKTMLERSELADR